MRADREDRVTADDTRRRHSTQTLITAIAVLILAAGAYLLVPDEPAPEPAPAQADDTAPLAVKPAPPRPDPVEAIRSAPDIPVPRDETERDAEQPPAEQIPEEDAAEATVVEATPPTPEELDAQLRRALQQSGLAPAEVIAPAFNAPYLLDRGVSSADQLARGLVPRRTLNLPRPRGAFATLRDGQQYRVDPAGYQRYDRLVGAITALPVDTLAGLFQRFRTELGDAYASLGYPPDAMDNTVIAALDGVIGAPVRDEPPLLRSKGALWAYADPTLEESSDLHRQLLRSGPQNTRALQTWALELRNRLLNP